MSRSLSDASFRSTLLTASINSPTRRSFNSRDEMLCATCTRSFSGEAGTDESATSAGACKPGSLLIAIFSLRTWQQFEECIQTSVQRPPQLGNRPINRVQRQSGLSILEFEPALVDTGQRPFGHKPDAVHQRVARHDANYTKPPYGRGSGINFACLARRRPCRGHAD